MKRLLVAILLLFVAGLDLNAGTIKSINLAKGRADDNTLKGPVLMAAAPLEIGTFVQGFPPGSPLYRFKSGGVIGGKDKAGPDLELGKLLALALRGEAPRMGFQLGSGGWKIEGKVRALYYDLRSNGWGMFYYGTLAVDLEVVSPQGDKKLEMFRLFNFDPEFAKDPDEAIAQMLVEGAQEILARLNLMFFKFQPDPSVKAMAEAIAAASMKDKDLECASAGLSGSPEVAAILLDTLPRAKDENERSLLVNALARLEDSRAIPVLISRFRGEDEDVRWFTLNALGYMGTKEATDFIRSEGLKDADKACRALAEDLLAAAGPEQPTLKSQK